MASIAAAQKHSHAHDHDHHHHGHDHDHGHAKISLGVAVIGSILIICSGLVKIVYDNAEFLSDASAFVGAVILAAPIVITAIKDLMKGRVHIDVLVGIALLAAFVIGEYQEAGIIAFFMLLAITLEEKTAIGAQASIEDLVKLTPTTARRLLEGDREEEVQALSLRLDDVVRVRPGENFPADGVIVNGVSTVNQASITGESLPVDKNESDEVFAGTQNLTGMVDVKVTKVGEDTTLGKVRDLIVQAEQTRLPIVRMIDQYSIYYTPTILMIAALVWFLTPATEAGLMRFVYVVVIGCPCALVIATPSAVVAAIASAARLGMLIKNVAHIEVAAKIRTVIFDKTGTLTQGNLEVARLNPAEGVDLSDLLTVAVSAESQSNHPAAKAMRKLADDANVKWSTPSAFQEVHGKGVIASFSDGEYKVGRESWFKEIKLDTAALSEAFKANPEYAGMSVIYVARDEKVLGWIGLRDAVRPGAKDAIKRLNALGIRQTCMFTGDHDIVAKNVAGKLGISEYRADLLPAEKVAYVEEMSEKGEVAVVGDGVNDAPALAAGDISVAMGAIGSDIAINSASIALMNNDLRRIPFLIELSRRTRTIINLNLLFGVFLIVGGLMFFIFGDSVLNDIAQAVHIKESVFKALAAAVVHILGTLVVVFNSARLVRFGEDLDQMPLND